MLLCLWFISFSFFSFLIFVILSSFFLFQQCSKCKFDFCWMCLGGLCCISCSSTVQCSKFVKHVNSIQCILQEGFITVALSSFHHQYFYLLIIHYLLYQWFVIVVLLSTLLHRSSTTCPAFTLPLVQNCCFIILGSPTSVSYSVIWESFFPDWKSHGSEYYECSRYKENPNIANESVHVQAREALKKYLFYFERVRY